MRTLVTCPSCGASVAAGNRRCPACGSRIPRFKVQATPVEDGPLPVLDAEAGIAHGQTPRHAQHAAAPMTTTVPTAPSLPTTPQDSPPSSAQPSRFCRQCGMPLKEGDGFCRQCGTPVPRTENIQHDVFHKQKEQQVAAGTSAAHARTPKNGTASNGVTSKAQRVRRRAILAGAAVALAAACAVVAAVMLLRGPANSTPDTTSESAVSATTVKAPSVVADPSMEAGQVATWDCVWFGS